MNHETNSEVQGTQQEKAASNKRSNRAGKNRPALVSSTSNDQVMDQPVVETSDATLPVAEDSPTTKVEDARPRRLPKFFSSVGKDTKEQTEEADPRAARIARATRGSGGSPANNRTIEESKATEPKSSPGKVASTKTTARAASTATPQRPGGFKMRYLLGMLLYLLLAEVIGGFEKNLLVSNHLDKLLFQLGPLAITTSTALFLLTLLILLLILARLDLVPRNLGALMGQSTTQRGRSGQSQNTSDSEARGSQPTMKQGVKGEDDDLYQEYREQQRYLQRRERKR